MYGFRFMVYGLDFARSVKPPVTYILVSVDYLQCSMRTSLSYPKWLKIHNIEATTVSFLSEVDFASAIMGKTVTVHA